MLNINKIENFDNFIWVMLLDYLIGLDVNYKMYIYTIKNNLFISNDSDFLFDFSNKIYISNEQHDYLNNIRKSELINFKSKTHMIIYLNRLKVINKIIL